MLFPLMIDVAIGVALERYYLAEKKEELILIAPKLKDLFIEKA